MKKLTFSLGLILLALFSCSKAPNTTTPDSTENGKVKLTIAFEKDPVVFGAISSNAVSSLDAIPVTKWTDIKNIRILFVNETTGNVVRSYFKTLNISAATGLTPAVEIAEVSDIPLGTYKIIALANAESTNNITNILGSATTPPVAWTDPGLKFQPLTSLFMGVVLKDNVSVGAPAVSQVRYFTPGQLFGDVLTGNVIVKGDNEITFNLKREVSMLRVRIDKNGRNISFTGATAEIKLHRTPLVQQVAVGSLVGSIVPNSILTCGTTTTTAPTAATHVNFDQILVAPYTEYAEIIVFPNTDRSGTNVLQSGGQNVRYTVSLKGLSTAIIGSRPIGTPFYFSGVIDKPFKPNQIVEANIKLTSNGDTIEITDEDYGNCEIKATVSPWGLVEGVNMEL